MARSGSASRSWLEPVLLARTSERASRLSDEARARMKPWVIAAEARFAVARELRDARTQTVALALLKEAAFLALCALQAGDPASEGVAHGPREAWEHFDALAEKPAGAPAELAVVRTAFGTDDALAVDLVAPSRANELRLAAESSVAWLLELAEVRTPAELARARLLRIALAVAGLMLALWAFVAYWSALSAVELR